MTSRSAEIVKKLQAEGSVVLELGSEREAGNVRTSLDTYRKRHELSFCIEKQGTKILVSEHPMEFPKQEEVMPSNLIVAANKITYVVNLLSGLDAATVAEDFATLVKAEIKIRTGRPAEALAAMEELVQKTQSVSVRAAGYEILAALTMAVGEMEDGVSYPSTEEGQ